MTEAHKHYTFMKKVFTKGLLLLVLLLCGVGNMQSQDFLYDGLWYTVLDAENKTCQTKSGHLLNGGNVVTGHLVLPSTVYNNGEAYTLTELGDYSFNGNSCDGLLSVELPNTLTRIGIMAFASATELESIVIPEGVKEIADGAFCACIILSDIRLPQSLEVIGAYAFQDIHSVTIENFTIPSHVTEIGGMVFENTHINNLVVECQIPPTIKEFNGSLSFVEERTTIYVPKGTIPLYKAAPGWSELSNYKEIDRPIIYLNKHKLNLVSGEESELFYTYVNDGQTMLYSPQWSSSDESVVSISTINNGMGVMVKALKEGTATVTFTVHDAYGNPSISDFCEITVKPGAVGMSLSTNSLTMNKGEEDQLIVSLNGVAPGTCKVTVTLSNDKSVLYTETCDVTVLDVATDIETVFKEAKEDLGNVYNISGMLIKANATPKDVKSLAPGLYIIGNQKYLIK